MPDRSQPKIHHRLSHLPLRPSTLSTLTRRGFNSTAEVQSSRSSGISTFAAELDIPLVEAAGIGREIDKALRHISSGKTENSGINVTTDDVNNFGALSAASILSAHYNNQKTFSSRPIITFARTIDTLLGGGIQPKEVTEIAGSPGVGKTQLAMQLCVDASLPKEFGGVAGSSCYIDSEGSFSPDRCWDMAHALVQHVHNSAVRSKSKTVPESFTPEHILDSINVFRVYDETSQTATITSLPDFLDQMEQKGHPVKVLVVDSIAFHYRCSSADYNSRTKSLSNIAATLADIANKYNLAVVVINQMTTKVGGAPGNQNYNVRSMESSDMNQHRNNFTSSRLIPALGESWAHATTTRLLLMMDSSRENSFGAQAHQRRICKLCKSPHKPSGRALFSITQFGIRDCFPMT